MVSFHDMTTARNDEPPRGRGRWRSLLSRRRSMKADPAVESPAAAAPPPPAETQNKGGNSMRNLMRAVSRSTRSLSPSRRSKRAVMATTPSSSSKSNKELFRASPELTPEPMAKSGSTGTTEEPLVVVADKDSVRNLSMLPRTPSIASTASGSSSDDEPIDWNGSKNVVKASMMTKLAAPVKKTKEYQGACVRLVEDSCSVRVPFIPHTSQIFVRSIRSRCFPGYPIIVTLPLQSAFPLV